jgi:hypothetical protein
MDVTLRGLRPLVAVVDRGVIVVRGVLGREVGRLQASNVPVTTWHRPLGPIRASSPGPHDEQEQHDHDHERDHKPDFLGMSRTDQ